MSETLFLWILICVNCTRPTTVQSGKVFYDIPTCEKYAIEAAISESVLGDKREFSYKCFPAPYIPKRAKP